MEKTMKKKWRVRTQYEVSKNLFGKVFEASSREEAKQKYCDWWDSLSNTGCSTSRHKCTSHFLFASPIDE